MKKTISQIVSERILILDGAMGTMIQPVSYTHLDVYKRQSHTGTSDSLN